jgi:hypothetical protein
MQIRLNDSINCVQDALNCLKGTRFNQGEMHESDVKSFLDNTYSNMFTNTDAISPKGNKVIDSDSYSMDQFNDDNITPAKP